MFEFTPFLDGKKLDYGEYFSLYFFLGLLAIGSVLLLISLLFKFLGKVLLQKQGLQQQYGNPQLYMNPDMLNEQLNSFLDSHNPRAREVSCLIKTGNVFSHIGWFFYGLLPVALSSFDVLIPTWVAMIIMFAILNIPRRKYEIKEFIKMEQKYKNCSDMEKKKGFDRWMKAKNNRLILIAALSFIWPFLLMGICLGFFDTRIGIIKGTLSISTSVSRFFDLKEACPPGPPCHVYATLPEDSATSVFINAHTNTEYEEVYVRYQAHARGSQFTLSEVKAYSFTTEGLDFYGNRNVHSALLTGLLPDTMYTIEIYYDGQVQDTQLYRTLPDENSDRDIVIVTGGDMGINDRSRDLTTNSLKYNVDVLVVGGDLAYDDNLCACYFSWDFYIAEFELLNKMAGRMIPFVYGYGNHDFGLNALPNKVIPINRRGPAALMYFPMHLSKRSASPAVPVVEERLSYHYHRFGKILFLILDSGYIADYNGPQLGFLRDAAKDHLEYVKFSVYHNPNYYSCDTYDNKDAVEAGLVFWGPLFDEFKFAAAFENHEHTFKKSFPLIDNKRAELGTYYLGNGNWGVDLIESCNPNNATGLLEVVERKRHVWMVNVSTSNNLISYNAFDESNNLIIPEFSQQITDYVMEKDD